MRQLWKTLWLSLLTAACACPAGAAEARFDQGVDAAAVWGELVGRGDVRSVRPSVPSGRAVSASLAAGGETGPSYRIDKRDVVEPMMRRVDEARLAETIAKLSGFTTRHYRSKDGAAAARWLGAHWSSLAGGRTDIEVEPFSHAGWPQDSVIATVRGSVEPDRLVILGAHLDSKAYWWKGPDFPAPGADDNASGVAVITEALRIIAESGYRPAKTVQLIAFAAEEGGLKGSREIAAAYKAGGVDVEGVVNFDMTNRAGSSADIYLISDYTDRRQNEFLIGLIEEYTDYTYGFTECGYGCSDHVSWKLKGYAVSYPFESEKADRNPAMHTPDDTLERAGGARNSVKFAELAIAYLVEMAKGGTAHSLIASALIPRG